MEDTTMLGASAGLFQDTTFTIIPTLLSSERVDQLIQTLEKEGATVLPFDVSTGRIANLKTVRYIISASSDFPDYYRTLDLDNTSVVKPSFVDACMNSGKLKGPWPFNPDPALFMSEVVVCCGDIPEYDQSAIQGGVTAMGGQFSEVLSKTVTHLIALAENDSRFILAKQKRLNIKTVLPHWFDDCVKVGRRISERPYMLPEPEILNLDAGAISGPQTHPDVRNATNPEPSDEPVASTPPAHFDKPRSIKAFADKKVKLGSDLNINARLKEVITDLIENGGGKVTKNIKEADIYVCNYRDGDDYVMASQADKDVGNLSWLYFLITHDEWTNPMRRMMHYPRPRDGIPGFNELKISISSYTGDARTFLENLVKASGAQFTKTFKQDNTHLIAAHKSSEKYEAAQEWGIDVVNNIWLEECYAQCKKLPLSVDPRFTHFPPRTNLGEILGCTEIDRDVMRTKFFSKSPVPQPAKSKGRSDAAPASSVATGRGESDRAARSSPSVNKTSSGTKSVASHATPRPSRRSSGKENETPGTSGSRDAKARAMSKMHDQADDINMYEKEQKRKGGVIHGGRRRKEDEISDKTKKNGRESTSSKRSIDEVDANDSTTEETEATEPLKNKKARKGPLTPIKHRMVISGDPRWLHNADKQSKDKARMRELGLFITDDYKNVTLLSAPKVMRTEKFVAALACSPTLVSTGFLDYALKHNKLPPPEKHPLDVSKFEEDSGLSMEEVLVRAKQNKHRLLKDFTIYCTPKIEGGFDTYKHIIEANGGKCMPYKGRGIKATVSRRQIDPPPYEVSQNLLEDDPDVCYLISDTSKTEQQWWAPFRKDAERFDMIPRIVSKEWILHVAVAQKMMWEDEWELQE